MNTASSPASQSRLGSSAIPVALSAFVTVMGCGTQLTPALAEVSGRAVEVVEAGEGTVTVVFESGLGDDWSPWDEVAAQVAVETRVLAYSRPGYGSSDPSPDPRDPGQIVQDLRALLWARDLAPPYVLVGHSFGGTYMELFAKAHPDEVAGLVLVDPRHRDFSAACEELELAGCGISPAQAARLPKVQRDELEGFELASAEIRAAGGFADHPVRVLTATAHAGFSPEVEALWGSLLGRLAAEASDGDQIQYAYSPHYLQLARAGDVADEIIDVARAAED